MVNLVLLCRHHHRLVHEAGYQVRALPGQRFTFHRPDGTLITGAAPPVAGDAGEPARANAAAGAVVDDRSLVPDWDGAPTDYDAALQVLWGATFPDDRPGGDSVSAVPPGEDDPAMTPTRDVSAVPPDVTG